ncbi:hypothetical protein CUMW_073020 [Citrus unshiu]|nr:hypothetical protein CUMW_073020 [Citrus unshiu]
MNCYFHISFLKIYYAAAVVCWGEGEPWKVEEIQVEPPKATEVRFKMLYASICHTDVLSSKGFPLPLFPRVLGHEGVGMVESIGDEVKELKEGDIVIPTFIGECRECENCTSEMANLCLKYPFTFHGLMPDGSSRMSIRGQKLYHIFTCSTMTEYMVVDANYVVKVDPSIDLSLAGFLSCGYSSGFGAAWKEFKVEKGSSVAVFGLGAVGLGVMDRARIQGAAKIIGIDKNPCRKDKGEAFGMTDFINPDDEPNKSISELVKEMTHGTGVDYGFECTGVASLISESLEATKLGKGKVMAIGAANEAKVPLNFPAIALGRNLKGTIFGGIKTKSELPIILDKCKNKQLQVDQLLTHQVMLEDLDKAIKLLKQPDCVKVLIKI